MALMKHVLQALKNLFFVTSRGRGAPEDYFDHSPTLEQELRKKGKNELLEILKNTNMDSEAIAYTRLKAKRVSALIRTGQVNQTSLRDLAPL